jgi:uncharacterized membrane protein
MCSSPADKSPATPWWLPSFTGLFLGFLFFILTFTPSLVPRPPLFQGLLGGVAFFIGYSIGHGGVLLWRYLELLEVPQPWWRAANIVLGLICVVAAAIYIPRAAAWQDEVRARLNMPPAETANLVQVFLVSAVVAVLLMLLARLLIGGIRAASAVVYRWVPRRIAALLGAVIFAVLLVTVVNGTLISTTISAIDRAQALVDVTNPPGASMPTEATRSGGPGSQIAWQDLGRAGKRFVTEGPRKADIEAFTGRPALEPIRVYAGLRTANSPEEQAQAALADLIKVGAFSRSILVIATPTGTGWVDNNGVAPLEVMQDGDVATVAVQYSYLQSPLSLILEPGRSQKSAAAVFRVIYRYWKSLPKGRRPKLYLFGLSLGSLGSEDSPPMHAWLGASFDGAVWAGPPFRNRIWRAVQRDRDEGSPLLAAGLRGRLELPCDRPRRQRHQGAVRLGTSADRLSRLSQRCDRLFRREHVLPAAPMDGPSEGGGRVSAAAMVPDHYGVAGRDRHDVYRGRAAGTRTRLRGGRLYRGMESRRRAGELDRRGLETSRSRDRERSGQVQRILVTAAGDHLAVKRRASSG